MQDHHFADVADFGGILMLVCVRSGAPPSVINQKTGIKADQSAGCLNGSLLSQTRQLFSSINVDSSDYLLRITFVGTIFWVVCLF